LIIDLLILL